MKNRYEEAMIKYGPINLPWDNFHEFQGENNVEEDEKMEDEDETVENAQVPELDKKLCCAFYDTYRTPNFAFRYPIIHYILKNANHRTLRKLFSTCKYFFAKQPTPICYRLENYHYREMYVKENLYLEYSSNQNLLIKNTFITGCIDVKKRKVKKRKECQKKLVHDFTFMSKLIPRLFRCEAKYIYIADQELSFNELEFLIDHGEVVDLDIEYSDIRNENNGFVELEKIMALLTNIKWLKLPDIKTTINTGLELTKLNFNAKIVQFSILEIHGEPLNAHEFLKFIIANRNEKHFKCRLAFYEKNFNADFIGKFNKVMEDYEKSCENTRICVDYD
uniref:F-box domain-containing protein n=1 Tax=Panagrolaimus davidi TaxID=227884 RepID=A0A914PDJ9_9BILA